MITVILIVIIIITLIVIILTIIILIRLRHGVPFIRADNLVSHDEAK